MFDFDLSDELKIILRKLIHKDKKKVEIIEKNFILFVDFDHHDNVY